MDIKAKITETAERLYDLSKKNTFSLKAGFPGKITAERKTSQTKKWAAKNR